MQDTYLYYERGFAKYFGLNLAKFQKPIGGSWKYFDIEKFKRILFSKHGYNEGSMEYAQSASWKKTALDCLLESHYTKNACKFFNNLLGEELPF